METQKTKKRIVDIGSGNDLFGDLGGSAVGTGVVRVVHGTYDEALPVAEMSIAQVRSRFGDLLDIHPEATGQLDGVPVGDDVIVQAGQLLLFVRPAGEKGGAR